MINPFECIDLQFHFNPDLKQNIMQIVKVFINNVIIIYQDNAYNFSETKIMSQDYNYTIIFEFKEDHIDQAPCKYSLISSNRRPKR